MKNNIVVKGYQINREIDSSVFSTIYEALNLKNGQNVFMTIISAHRDRDLIALKNRAAMSQKLTLPSLVTALDFGTLPEQRFYFTHPNIPSLPLTRILDTISDPTEQLFSTIGFFIDALEILCYIHDANVTHRDLNTSQIRVVNNEKILLEGFINPKLKLESRNIANIVYLPYTSPEQLTGSPSDIKTDIYSMGVVLYELITRELPYPSNYSKIEDARQGVTPSPSKHREGLPSELENIMMRALSPRKSRYVHTREWITELEDFYDKRSFRMKVKDFSSTVKQLFSSKT